MIQGSRLGAGCLDVFEASQAEVVRRSLEIAESSHAQGPDIQRRLDAAGQLRARLKSRNINVEAWVRAARESRR